MIPAMVGDLEMVKILVDAGADIQFEDPYGHSALSIAREQDHEDVYRFLVRAMGARS